MGVNIYCYFLEGTNINNVKTYLSRLLGSPVEMDKDGQIKCTYDYASCVEKSFKDEVNEKLEKQHQEEDAPLKVKERRLKVLNSYLERKRNFEKYEDKINEIIGETEWAFTNMDFDYKNIYLKIDNDYMGEGTFYYGKSNSDKVFPKGESHGYMYLGCNLKWAFLANKMVDFFGGKVIWADSDDFDNPENFKMVEKKDAICQLNVGDDKKNNETFFKALRDIQPFDLEEIERFAEVRGYSVKDGDKLLLGLRYQNNLMEEQLKRELSVQNKQQPNLIKKPKLNKF